MNKVLVSADELGNIIGISPNNPEYGYIRVQQVARQIGEDGWTKLVKRSALLKGTVKDLEESNFYAGEELPGKIIVRESFEPVNENDTNQNLKMAGVTGVICRVDDQPIYRETYYTNNLEAEDTFIQHTNKEEIREAQAAAQSMDTLLKVKRVHEEAAL